MDTLSLKAQGHSNNISPSRPICSFVFMFSRLPNSEYCGPYCLPTSLFPDDWIHHSSIRSSASPFPFGKWPARPRLLNLRVQTWSDLIFFKLLRLFSYENFVLIFLDLKSALKLKNTQYIKASLKATLTLFKLSC